MCNVNDVGKAINPEGVEGQQYGGSIMAVSRSRFEEVVWDMNTGVILNGNLLDYKIATILDCGPIEPTIVETDRGYGPYGANGIGEDVGDHWLRFSALPCTTLSGLPSTTCLLLPARSSRPLGRYRRDE